jgi:hypothetical protein
MSVKPPVTRFPEKVPLIETVLPLGCLIVAAK